MRKEYGGNGSFDDLVDEDVQLKYADIQNELG